jgi:hypothetical protein
MSLQLVAEAVAVVVQVAAAAVPHHVNKQFI